jgi:hypothetical protein
MSGINFIADVAGRFDELLQLVAKMPPGHIVLLGDLNDRGPNSKEVIEWAMQNEGTVTTLHSNHGELFVDFVMHHMDPDWASIDPGQQTFLKNGGVATLLSYKPEGAKHFFEFARAVPMSHIQWLRSRPLTFERDDVIATHAPIHERIPELGDIEEVTLMNFQYGVLWNRQRPRKREKFQIFGHNGKLHWYRDNDAEEPWAVCIDQSLDGQLCGMHWPSKELYTVPYTL